MSPRLQIFHCDAAAFGLDNSAAGKGGERGFEQ